MFTCSGINLKRIRNFVLNKKIFIIFNLGLMLLTATMVRAGDIAVSVKHTSNIERGIQVNWTNANYANYRLYIEKDGVGSLYWQSFTSTTKTWHDGSLSPGVRRYKVKGCDTNGICSAYSPWSANITIKPEVMATPVVSLDSPTSITVKWNKSIYSNATYTLDIEKDGQSYPQSGLTAGFRYWSAGVLSPGVRRYRVQVCYSGGACSEFSPWSEKVTILPAKMDPPTVARIGNVTQVSWHDHGVDTSYNLRFIKNGVTYYRTGLTAPTISFTDLPPGIRTYQVQAYTAQTTTEYSNFSTKDIIFPVQYPDLTVSQQGTHIAVNWPVFGSDVSGYADPDISYTLDIEKNLVSYPQENLTVLTKSWSAPSGGERRYRVKTCYQVETCSNFSAWSSIVYTDYDPKYPPANLTKTRGGTDKIFPLGWYSESTNPVVLEYLKNKVNIANFYGFFRKTETQQTEILNNLQDNNLIAMPVVPIEHGNIAQTYKDLITDWQGYPAIAGYMLADEPTRDESFKPASYIEIASKAVNDHDSTKNRFLVDDALAFGIGDDIAYTDSRFTFTGGAFPDCSSANNTGSAAAEIGDTYLTHVDVPVFDIYPISIHCPVLTVRNLLVPNRLKKLTEKMRSISPVKPVVIVLQAWGEGAYGASRRKPTMTELRYMTYSSVVHGARGVLYYSFKSANELSSEEIKVLKSTAQIEDIETELSQNVHKVIMNMKALNLPDLIMNDTSELPVVGINASINNEISHEANLGINHLLVKYAANSYYLIVVNDSLNTYGNVNYSIGGRTISTVTIKNDYYNNSYEYEKIDSPGVIETKYNANTDIVPPLDINNTGMAINVTSNNTFVEDKLEPFQVRIYDIKLN